MNTLEAFHMRCQRQILDVCWWAHVSDAEVLRRSGLSTIGDIFTSSTLIFGHVARLDPRHDDALFKFTYLLEKTAGSPSQRLARQGSGGCQRSTTAIYTVEIWDRQGPRSGATVHSDYATTTMMMKDDLCQKMEGKTNFSRRPWAVRNRDCWVFEDLT